METAMLDTLWIIMAAGLVFLMQPGFMCLESGMTRSKNNINVAIKNLADFVFSVLAFWAVGYGLMFGNSFKGIAGVSHFFADIDSNYALAVFFFFQAMFCGTATTIFSGAVAERMRFSAYMLISVLMSVLIYPLFGHWAWNGLNTNSLSGFIGMRGFVDFAGSTVVHSVGGWVSLAALIVIGPRQGRFPKDGAPLEINANNIPLSVLGTLLLWFGWFGFNGGSTLAMNAEVPAIIVRTTLAGAAGALSCLLAGWWRSRISRVHYLINGSLGGLVAITANCHCVSTLDSVIIGLAAGIICLAVEDVLLRFKIDDAVGAIPVHLGCGIWGTLAVAIFGDPAVIGTGLGFGSQLLVQLEGIASAFAVAFLMTWFLLRRLNRFFPLRVSFEDEHIGLNISEHGARTDLIDLFQAMDRQATSGNLSIRAPEEPFTEVGGIAKRYNSVMDALEKAISQTEAIVRSAKDAIIIFTRDTMEIMNINPGGVLMFGHDHAALVRLPVSDLFILKGQKECRNYLCAGTGESFEIHGKKHDGSIFPVEAVVTEASVGKRSFYVGIFRDITERKNRERSLRESEKRYRSFFENTGTAIIIIEEDATVSLINSEFEKLSGYTKREVEGRMRLDNFFPAGEMPRIMGNHRLRRINARKAPCSYETEIVDCSQVVKPVFIKVSMVPNSSKSLCSIMDLSKLRHVEESLQKQRAYFHQLFENSPQAIVITDIDGRVVNINKGFEALFGYELEEIIGNYNRLIIVPKERLAEAEAFNKTVRGGKPINKENYRKHKSGRLIPVSVLGYPIQIKGRVEGVFYIYEDITERKAFEEQLYQQAFYDALTGIPNRILFMERLERAVERGKRRKAYAFAVMLIDLDRFKFVNDSLGHLAGDTLLKEVAARFQKCIRAVDTVARLGGDEFAILLEEFEENQDVIRIARRLLNSAEEPFFIEKNKVFIGASIGIVINTEKYKISNDILRDADIAMYRAKELGKGRFKVFNRQMHESALESLKLENDLRHAIENGELLLYYQPIISTATQNLEGFEALVRWNHPEEGLVSPARFIPMAEETGLIIPLGQWVIAEACRCLKQWHKTIPAAVHLSVNVNVSAKQFLQRNLVEFIAETLRHTELDPAVLHIELTESAIMKNPGTAIKQLKQLKALGVKLLVDDFGTGYSSLSYLQMFPIDCLKIDRSFFSGRDADKENSEIIKTIVDLARNLGLDVVAEGVEEESQLDKLRDMFCDSAQGYLFSKPVDGNDATEIINRSLALGS